MAVVNIVSKDAVHGDILQSAQDLQEHVEAKERELFALLSDADYDRGDVVFLPERYRDLLPDYITNRVRINFAVPCDSYIVAVGAAYRETVIGTGRPPQWLK